MDRYVQHANVSCLNHCLSVAYTSYWVCERLGLSVDRRSLIRGALLHDFFLYDWHEKSGRKGLHGFTHPRTALENAQRRFSPGHHLKAHVAADPRAAEVPGKLHRQFFGQILLRHGNAAPESAGEAEGLRTDAKRKRVFPQGKPFFNPVQSDFRSGQSPPQIKIGAGINPPLPSIICGIFRRCPARRRRRSRPARPKASGTAAARRCARKTFPCSGNRPFESRSALYRRSCPSPG